MFLLLYYIMVLLQMTAQNLCYMKSTALVESLKRGRMVQPCPLDANFFHDMVLQYYSLTLKSNQVSLFKFNFVSRDTIVPLWYNIDHKTLKEREKNEYLYTLYSAIYKNA